MKKTAVILVTLLMCVMLNSCRSERPEDKFIGTWKGIVDGESVTVRFMDQGVIVVAAGDARRAGTWSADEGGTARIVGADNDLATATLTPEGRIIVREGDRSAEFEKVPKAE